MWSKAYTGTSPELIGVLLRSVHYIFSNLVFFLPRRDVHIECQDMTDILKEWHTLGLDVFNERLQNYYNESGNEPCRYIPHYFYHDDTVGKREPQSIE